MSVLIFLIVLFTLILVHEWGHFIAAKKTGMRVDEFGIGFPPRLFSRRYGETEYTLNALPIGGFVKIYGENAADAEQDAVEKKDISRSFTSKSKWAQAIVLVAGVTMNILFAWLIFSLVFTVGVPSAVEEEKAGPTARLIVSEVLPKGPADLGELPAGAEVTALRSTQGELANLLPSEFSRFVAGTDAELTLTYLSKGEEKTVTLQPIAGVIESEPERPALGVAVTLVETISLPVHEAIWRGLVETVSGLGAVTVGLAQLFVGLFTGSADLSQVAGPVGLVGLVDDAAGFGFTSLLLFTAFISLNLAVINLFPFPALDGGRLVMVGLEALLRRPINPLWVARVNFAGFALLMLLMVAVTWSDISKLF